jgi:aspartyl-tRNA(Asn)/glutamyl-tRNA(Gln) amidotransferase subunit B
MGDITGYLKESKLNISQTKITPENLAEMIDLIDKGTISSKIAKDIIVILLEKGGSPKEIVEKQGISVISDEGQLKEIIDKIISANPSEVEAYRSGKTKLFGFFVGQAMKQTQGRANPRALNDLVKQALEG